jgi:hypothetical protein
MGGVNNEKDDYWQIFANETSIPNQTMLPKDEFTWSASPAC